MADGEHYTMRTRQGVVRYRYDTGEAVDTLLKFSTLPNDIVIDSYTFGNDERTMLLSFDSKPLYRRSAYSRYGVYDVRSGSFEKLVDSDSVRYALLSPDATKVAFVVDNDIYIKHLTDRTIERVTHDGLFNHIINGLPDWVYEEEWEIDNELCWSPDSRSLAYLRSDESAVKEFSFTRYKSADYAYPETYSYKYPKAGEHNSTVSLHLYSLNSATTVDIDSGNETDQYIPFFDFTPDGQLYFYRINRHQNHLEVILAAADGSGRVIYDERSPKYIDDISLGTITFLSDSKRFIVRNETATGWFHLYLYSVDKGLLKPITSGEWEVTDIVESNDRTVWYRSTEPSPLRRAFYSISTDGKHKQLLSRTDGTVNIAAAPDCRYYLSNFSNSTTPTVVTLHKGDGSVVRTLEDNGKLREELAAIKVPEKRFFTFTTPEGYELNCYMVFPVDFDQSKRYPVFISQYSGPGSQDIADRWSIGWEYGLVDSGYILAGCDPRGTGFRGEEFKKLTYGIMGRLETEDQISAARYFATLPYVDPDRIGIYGWSYGGFMALNCILKGADCFKAAVSVAPVTSWRFYDSVYTERVNGLPAENAEGYDEPSPIGYAANLKGKLLLIHGTADDNVHFANSMMMLHDFVANDKQIEFMAYPDCNHSMVPWGRGNIYVKMIDFVTANL